MIIVPQIKAARAMLNFSQQDLADKAGISVATLNNIERGAQKDPKLSTLNSIRNALEAGGIEFLDEASGGYGIRLKPITKKSDKPIVLIIDDSDADRLLYKRWLTMRDGKNYQIVEADNAKKGFETFLQYNPDCIILDFNMYGMDGFQLMVEMKKDYPVMPPIIFVTGMHDKSLEQKVRQYGVHAYLDKNYLKAEELQQIVDGLFESAKQRKAAWQ